MKFRKAAAYYFLLIGLSIVACRATGPGGENPRTMVIFNVSALSSDSCRCRANKFKIDSNLGYHCRPVDSMLIAYSRNGNEPIEYTDSVGLTQAKPIFASYGRYYFIKKGYPVLSITLQQDTKAVIHAIASGCDVFMKRIPGITPVYYLAVVIRPTPKKGVKLIPYKPSAN